MALEVVLLVPVMVLLALFVMWAGRGGRTALLADLAAEEAAVAAALCCLEDDHASPANEAGREAIAEDVLESRPGMEFLCIGGPQPRVGANGSDGFVSEAWMDFPDGQETRGVGVLSVNFSCETDGAVAPLRGAFPTVVFGGQAAEVVVLPAAPTVTIDDASAFEGYDVEIKVRLDATSTEAVQLRYSTSLETAPDQQQVSATALDFDEQQNVLLEIPAGNLESTVTVPTTDDAFFERDEVFYIDFEVMVDPLATDPPPLLSNPTVKATIVNDDDLPKVSFSGGDVSAREGDDLIFEITLIDSQNSEVASGLPVTVQIAYIDEGTDDAKPATQGDDYDPPLGEIVFQPGEESVTLKVVTVDDFIGEGTETFKVRLSDPVDAELHQPVFVGGKRVLDKTGTIIDNEPGVIVMNDCGDPNVPLASVCVDEGNLARFRVGLNRDLTENDQPVTVNVYTQQLTKEEADLFDPIIDEFEPQSRPARQGNSSDTTADYVERGIPTPVTLTFWPPGPGEVPTREVQTFVVETQSDELHEGTAEAFYLILEDENPDDSGWIKTPKSYGAIIDDDDPPSISVEGPSDSTEEGETPEFTVRLNVPSGREVWVDVYTEDGTDDPLEPKATASTYPCNDLSNPNSGDYEPFARNPITRIVFPIDDAKGTTSEDAIVPIQSCNDEIDEPDLEMFSLLATEPKGAIFPDSETTLSAVAAIKDNDVSVISAQTIRVVEPESPLEQDATYVTFTVSLSPASSQQVTVMYKLGTYKDTATAAQEAEDFETLTGSRTLKFEPGDTSKTVKLRVLHDRIDEHDEEYLRLEFFNPENADLKMSDPGTPGTMSIIGTIVDRNELPTLTLSTRSGTVQEGNPITFIASLSDKSGRDMWFNYATTDGTANAGSDYTSLSGKAYIAAGEGSVVIEVETLTDGVFELDETLIMRLTARPQSDPEPTWANLEPNTQAEGVITDITELPELSITYPQDDQGNPLPVPEGEALRFTLRLTRGVDDPINVSFKTIDGGTATKDADYTVQFATVTIEAGSDVLVVDVPTHIDGELEPGDPETVLVEIALETGFQDAAVLVTNTAEGAIRDGYVTIGFGPSQMVSTDEGDDFTIPIVLSDPIGIDVTVQFYTNRYSGLNGATPDDDYEHVPMEESWPVTIPAGKVTAEVGLGTVEDDIDEVDETFHAWVRFPQNDRPENIWLLDNVTIAWIMDDDDPPMVSVRATESSTLESDADTIVFEVNLSRRSSRGVRVPFEVFSSNSTLDVDFEMVRPSGYSGTLSFGAGDITRTVQVKVLDDAFPESDESVEMELGNPQSTDLAVLDAAHSRAAVTIIDDDLGVSVRVDESVGVEEGQPLTFTMELNRVTTEPLDVKFYTFEMSLDAATPNLDFDEVPVLRPRTVTIPADSREVTFSIGTIDDSIDEGLEVFQVRLVTPALDDPFILSDGSAVGVINDNDDPPIVSISPQAAEVTEGNQVLLSVMLSNPSSQSISVNYFTTNGTAAAPGDYVAVMQTVMFDAGETSHETTIDTQNDSVPEDDESFWFELDAPVPQGSASLGTSQAEVTIIDDDLSLSLGPDRVSGTEGTPLVFTVRLNTAAPTPISVPYYTRAPANSDAAAAGIDYEDVPEISPGVVVIPTGSRSATISITTYDDGVHEPDESFQVRIIGASLDDTVILDVGIATGVIEDDEPIPEVSVSAVSPTVSEGDTARFTLELSGQSSQETTVDYATVEGTASDPADFAGSSTWQGNSATAVFPAGITTLDVNIGTVDDALPEADETFELLLTNPLPSGGLVLANARAQVAITDRDIAVGLGQSPVVTKEDSGTATFVVEMNTTATTDVLVDYYTKESASNPATGGTDYEQIPIQQPRTVTIPAGSRTATLPVNIFDDLISEPTEHFQFELTNPRFAALLPGASVSINRRTTGAQIQDDDGIPEVSISAPDPVKEGEQLTFAVSLDRLSSEAITVGFEDVGGTASAPDDYHRQLPGTLIIRPGETVAQIHVSTRDDTIVEDDETVNLELTSVSPAGAAIIDVSVAEGIILDDDRCVLPSEILPSITSTVHTVREDAAMATFVFELVKPFCEDTQLVVRTSDLTAEAGADYSAVDASVTLFDEEQTFTVSVPIIDDSLVEIEERFTLELVHDGRVWVIATATIIDNDQSNLHVSDAVEREGEALIFSVSLDSPTPLTVGVQYSTADTASGLAIGGQAGSGADYEQRSGTLTFTASDPLTQLVRVEAFNDDVDDPGEWFELRLSNASNADLGDWIGVGHITQGECVNHTDPLSPLIAFSVPPTVEVAENVTGPEGLIPVTLGSRPCVGNVTYTATAEQHGNAQGTSAPVFAAGDDFRLSSDVSRFPDGESGNILYEFLPSGVHDDDVPEGLENFRVKFEWDDNNMPAHYHDVQPVYSVVTVIDDDAVLSVADSSEWEGSRVMFEVSLRNPVAFDVHFSYHTSYDSSGLFPATGGEGLVSDQDYAPVLNGNASIPAGDISVLIPIIAKTDVRYGEDSETFLFTIVPTSEVVVADATAIGTIYNLVVGCRPWAEIRDADLGYPGLEVWVPGQRHAERFTVVEGSTVMPFTLEYDVEICENYGMARWQVDWSEEVGYWGGLCRDIEDHRNPLPTLSDAAPEQDLWACTTNHQCCSYNHPFIWFEEFYPVDDNIHEGEETFVFYLKALGWEPVGGQVSERFHYEFELTVIDNDPVPQVRVANARAVESRALEFEVQTLTRSAVPIVVTYRTVPHSSAGNSAATAGEDYVAVASGSVTIQPGDAVATVVIDTLTDELSEGDESFLLEITGVTGATIAPGGDLATGTILDEDDCNSPTDPFDTPLALTMTPVTVNETDGTVTVTIEHDRLCGERTSAIRFGTVATSSDSNPPAGDTATPGADYTALDLGAVDTDSFTSESTFVVQIRDNQAYEDTETFTVWAAWGSGVDQSYQDLTRVTTTVTILEDDPPPGIRISDARARYGDELEFDVYLEDRNGQPAATELDVEITWRTRLHANGDDPAEPGADYTEVTSGFLTIPAGHNHGTIRVQTLTGDSGAFETMRVEITGAVNANRRDPIAVGTIYSCVDVQSGPVQEPSVSRDPWVEEGESLTFRFTVDQAFCSACKHRLEAD